MAEGRVSGRRVRMASERARNRDVGAGLSDGVSDDASDDPDFGRAARKPSSRSRRLSAAAADESESDDAAWLPELLPGRCEAPLDLKGLELDGAVGRRIRVFYESDQAEEGATEGAALEPFLGVVAYAEEGRLYVVFDGEDEHDGVWVDAKDEWEWATDAEAGPPPRRNPVAGMWRPGEDAGAIDKIFLSRRAEANTDDGAAETLEFLVKWKELSHRHCQWVPRDVLEAEPLSKRRVARFLAEQADEEGGDAAGGDEPSGFNPEYTEVERVIASRRHHEDSPPVFLVKWRSLPYASATWESCLTLLGDQRAIHRFRKVQLAPPAEEQRARGRPQVANFRPVDGSMQFKGGHVLQPHQLEGVNWLLLSWYAQRNVMLADEMGLGKTAQVIAALEYMRRHEHMRGPFLVVAPLSTLSHWVREVEAWTDFNAVMYHGSRESRKVIQKHEFYYSTPRPSAAPPPAARRAAPPPRPRAPATIDVRVVVPPTFIQGTQLSINVQGRSFAVTPPAGIGAGGSFNVKVPAPTPSALKTVAVRLPPHAQPGQQLQLPGVGGPITFTVPSNALPGGVIHINVPVPPEPTGGAGGAPVVERRESAPPRSSGGAHGGYKFEVLVTSYETVKEDVELLQTVPWRCLILDEVHRLKNKDSSLSACLRTLRAEQMFMMTGTPLQNNTTELWALLSLLDPSLFPSLEEFLKRFGTLVDAAQVVELQESIRPYLLRRRKGDVQLSLAPLEETVVWVEMTLHQKRTYRAILESKRELLVAGVANAPLPGLLNMQIELRKCCNHPFLVPGVEESMTRGMDEREANAVMLEASGKLVLLDKLLPKLRAEGHRVLIFSQFVIMLHLLADFLSTRSYAFERLDGSVTGDARQAAIDRYCKPGSDCFAFLLSTRAGGVGINLTVADTCIIFDSDWNPQNDLQAMARSHRIGQTKTVKVFRLITRNSYEEELVHTANRKLGLERAMSGHIGGDDAEANVSNGAPRDRLEIERMLRCGAQNIALDDDTAFRNFSGADIDEILQSSTSVISSGDGASTFSKVSFVADGEQIEMSDPEFWKKILPESNTPTKSPAQELRVKRQVKQQERYGMVRMRDNDNINDWLPKSIPVASRGLREAKRKRYAEDDSDGDYEDESESRRRIRSAARSTDYSSDGESASVVNSRLWEGAFAQGWRVHVRSSSHYTYRGPTGESFTSRSEALASLPSAAVVASRTSTRMSGRYLSRGDGETAVSVRSKRVCRKPFDVADEDDEAEQHVVPRLVTHASKVRSCEACEGPLRAQSAESEELVCNGSCGKTFFWGQALWKCRACNLNICAECCSPD
ncbi:hypothetical protein AB1Y20_008709 [Prymnesium parvum]|uniref:Uncharacterized protein n=1 Tax=Prymnesium parvum TaxID=97485 RepID=A0AB34IRX0_PRYPA